MKYLSIFAFILLVACNYSKTGNGKISKQLRSTAPFNKIRVSESIVVDIKQGTQTSVMVEADENIVPFLETINNGDELLVKLKNNVSIHNATLLVHIITPDISSLTASSAAQIVSDALITNMESIQLTASSASKIDIKLETPNVKVNASSGAEITASGRTKNIDVKASSGSTVDFQALHAEMVNAHASSGSNIKVYTSMKLDAAASSGSSINYIGGAAAVKKSESSGGSVSNN